MNTLAKIMAAIIATAAFIWSIPWIIQVGAPAVANWITSVALG